MGHSDMLSYTVACTVYLEKLVYYDGSKDKILQI
jgi:hypothetical protein